MSLYRKIRDRNEKISVIGLGYVGIPLAIAFAKKAEVIGYDIDEEKIEQYKKNIDVTKEVSSENLEETTIYFTSDEKQLKEAKFHIVAVPTPINDDKTPNLLPLVNASKTLGRNMKKGSIVVYESTVFPGVTEDICLPILEKESGLICGKDFKIGYSPERINPGDKVHTLEKITKVVSGMDEDTLDTIAKIYGLIIEAGVYRAESIKIAEASKIIENSQRDINIAFVNELSIVFNYMDIDLKSVLKAASTKWNFLKFTPGLVGGHCIGVDPYYFTYMAEQLGYHSQIILAGRQINDGMAKYVAENIIKKLIEAEVKIKGARVAIMGITFKEDCPDVRNTKVIDVIRELMEYGIDIMVCDPVANADEVRKEYGISLVHEKDIKDIDAIVFSVPHKIFESISLQAIQNMHNSHKAVLIDLKGIFNKREVEDMNYYYWRL